MSNFYKDEHQLIEIPKELAKKLPEGTTYFIYNPLTDLFKEEIASKKDIAHNKYAYEKLKYYKEEDTLKKIFGIKSPSIEIHKEL